MSTEYNWLNIYLKVKSFGIVDIDLYMKKKEQCRKLTNSENDMEAIQQQY